MSVLPAGPGQRPRVERSFTAVRAVLPAGDAAAFDAELEEITGAPVTDLEALDEFLSAWHRIAMRITADPEDWTRMNRQADAINIGRVPLGPTMEEMAARRGIAL